MPFFSETAKIRDRIKKYLKGHMLDIGCGSEKVDCYALGVDVRSLPTVDVVVSKLEKLSDCLNLPNEWFDLIFSSHCLEHISDDVGALNDWILMLNSGGHLVLYLPDVRYYKEKNPDHAHDYTLDSFLEFMKRFEQVELVDSGLDVGEDRYSFFVVYKKK